MLHQAPCQCILPGLLEREKNKIKIKSSVAGVTPCSLEEQCVFLEGMASPTLNFCFESEPEISSRFSKRNSSGDARLEHLCSGRHSELIAYATLLVSGFLQMLQKFTNSGDNSVAPDRAPCHIQYMICTTVWFMTHTDQSPHCIYQAQDPTRGSWTWGPGWRLCRM